MGERINSSNLTFTGTDRLIAASSRERIAKSLFLFIFSKIFSFAPFLKKLSRVLYFFSMAEAVLGPTPGTPGILSEASPTRAL